MLARGLRTRFSAVSPASGSYRTSGGSSLSGERSHRASGTSGTWVDDE
ncbi:hypothetical protein [Lysobacter gummosus]